METEGRCNQRNRKRIALTFFAVCRTSVYSENQRHRIGQYRREKKRKLLQSSN